MTQRDYIENRYGDGECGPFAEALHELTGLPLVLFVLDGEHEFKPAGFPRHAVVEMEDGRYLDACGVVTFDDIVRRLGIELVRSPSVDQEKYPFASGPGQPYHVAAEFDEVLDHARQMLGIHELQHLEVVLQSSP